MNFFIHYLSGYVIQRDYIEVPYRANVLEAWASKISFDQFSDLKKKDDNRTWVGNWVERTGQKTNFKIKEND